MRFFLLVIMIINLMIANPIKIDPTTGLVNDIGLDDVKENCTICHPGRFIVINGGDKNFWRKKVRTMQEAYGLWKIKKDKLDRMIDYLSKHYKKKKNF